MRPVLFQLGSLPLRSYGLLMAVAGYILGIYGALVCAWLLGIVGG